MNLTYWNRGIGNWPLQQLIIIFEGLFWLYLSTKRWSWCWYTSNVGAGLFIAVSQNFVWAPKGDLVFDILLMYLLGFFIAVSQKKKWSRPAYNLFSDHFPFALYSLAIYRGITIGLLLTKLVLELEYQISLLFPPVFRKPLRVFGFQLKRFTLDKIHHFFNLSKHLNTERSYITRLRCSACQSQIPTDGQCSHLIGLFTQV